MLFQILQDFQSTHVTKSFECFFKLFYRCAKTALTRLYPAPEATGLPVVGMAFGSGIPPHGQARRVCPCRRVPRVKPCGAPLSIMTRSCEDLDILVASLLQIPMKSFALAIHQGLVCTRKAKPFPHMKFSCIGPFHRTGTGSFRWSHSFRFRKVTVILVRSDMTRTCGRVEIQW